MNQMYPSSSFNNYEIMSYFIQITIFSTPLDYFKINPRHHTYFSTYPQCVYFVKSLCYIPDTKTILYINYTSIKIYTKNKKHLKSDILPSSYTKYKIIFQYYFSSQCLHFPNCFINAYSFAKSYIPVSQWSDLEPW